MFLRIVYVLTLIHIEWQICTLDAVLKSLLSGRIDRLWRNGNPEVWGQTLTLLFSVVGRQMRDTIELDGRKYQMPQHGFAMNCESCLPRYNIPRCHH